MIGIVPAHFRYRLRNGEYPAPSRLKPHRERTDRNPRLYYSREDVDELLRIHVEQIGNSSLKYPNMGRI